MGRLRGTAGRTYRRPTGGRWARRAQSAVLRRLLRSLAKDEAITQDVSTLENPAILDQLKQVN